MTFEEVIKTMVGSGPGYALVAALLFISRQIWVWLWDKSIDPDTKEMKGPAAQWMREYILTQQEMRHSIKTTAETVASGRVFDEQHSVSLKNIEQSIKNIETQLASVDKNTQSVSTQRVIRMLISTVLELAGSAGIDVTPHRTKFMAFLQDAAQ